LNLKFIEFHNYFNKIKMSVSNVYLKCSDCEHHFINLMIPVCVKYLLENGNSIDLGRSHVWCSDCRDIEI